MNPSYQRVVRRRCVSAVLIAAAQLLTGCGADDPRVTVESTARNSDTTITAPRDLRRIEVFLDSDISDAELDDIMDTVDELLVAYGYDRTFNTIGQEKSLLITLDSPLRDAREVIHVIGELPGVARVFARVARR
jgi:hypothetical protein